MKTLSIVLFALIMSGCSAITELSPVVTSQAYTKALNSCSEHGGVRMVNQSIPIKYTAYCNDGHKASL